FYSAVRVSPAHVLGGRPVVYGCSARARGRLGQAGAEGNRLRSSIVERYIANVTTRRLPLFPLPLVLFPGVPLPLHIFEPRYRIMLADCLEGDREFGIVFRPDGVAERDLPTGHVGCVAHVETTELLPDGRSNVIVRGTDRFVLDRYLDSARPYFMADTS